MNLNIGIIGVGNMGSAVFEGLKKLVPESSIYLCDRNTEKLNQTGLKNVFEDANLMLENVDLVVIAVKPQAFEEFVQSLTVSLENKIIVSIMAGVTLKKLGELTKSRKIVRAMPNLAIKKAKGVTGWIASGHIEEYEKEVINTAFSSFGYSIEVENEDMLDKITALSGSGPAYFYLLCELVEKKAMEMGFSEIESQKIAEFTYIGSAEIFKNESENAEEMRKAVTSKGGTTEAAIKHLLENGFDKTFYEAIEKAYKRSKELNQ